MPLFPREAVFMLARRLVPGFCKVLIAAAAAAAMGNQDALARLGQIRERFPRLFVEDQGTHRYLQSHVRAGMAGAIRAFPVAPAIGLEFTVIAVAQKCVVVGVGFHIYASAMAAVAAGGPAARHIFL